MREEATRSRSQVAVLNGCARFASGCGRLTFAGLAAILVSACGSAAPERGPASGPRIGDYLGAVGHALNAELRRPSADCNRHQQDPVWNEAAERMGERDRRARSGKVTDAQWRALDAQNRSELAELLRDRGWPEPCQLTRSAASELFYVVQHHTDPALRREALPHLEAMARVGQIRGGEAAMLIDRILRDNGEPQRFGTQYACRDGTWRRAETEDPANLEARRREMSLIPGDMEARLINAPDASDRCQVRAEAPPAP